MIVLGGHPKNSSRSYTNNYPAVLAQNCYLTKILITTTTAKMCEMSFVNVFHTLKLSHLTWIFAKSSQQKHSTDFIERPKNQVVFTTITTHIYCVVFVCVNTWVCSCVFVLKKIKTMFQIPNVMFNDGNTCPVIGFGTGTVSLVFSFMEVLLKYFLYLPINKSEI